MSHTPTSRCRDDELFTNASKLKTNIQNQQRRRFMSLQQKLDARKKETETSAPKEALEIMHRATEDLAKSGIMDRIVKKGGKAPEVLSCSAFTVVDGDRTAIWSWKLWSKLTLKLSPWAHPF
jgi:hypothetical protein